MPRNRSAPEPEVMTWPQAARVIVAGAVCDLGRAFFNLFLFFGPVLAALYCVAKVSSAAGNPTSGVVQAAIAAGCTALSGVAGVYGAAGFEFVGQIMSFAVGFMGFLGIGIWILVSNMRIFKTAASAPVWFIGAFAAAEVPFLGALPFFSVALWRLYSTQIKVERAAHKKWQNDNEAAIAEQRQQQMLQLQQMQQQQFEVQEAANDAQFEQEQQQAKLEQGELEQVARDTDAANDEQFTQEQAA